MRPDLSTVGHQTEAFRFEYGFRDTILYALGVGALADELDYLYEGRGPRVLPSFAVVPAYAPVARLFEKTRCDLTRLVHHTQTVRVHRPFPPSALVETVGRVQGIYDMKRLALVVFETRTTLAGELLAEPEWPMLLRDAGGFDGPRPPRTEQPKIPEGATPAFDIALPTTREQALLYRLSGDYNPLHADPEFAARAGFAEGPILHGLATFGVMTRALLKHLGKAPLRVTGLGAQFRRPVWPGETLRTTGFALGEGRFALEVFAAERPDPVITNAWASVGSSS